MATTPRLGLPLLEEGQELQHLSVNESLMILDFMAQPLVLSMSENDPPSSPSQGDAYIVGTGTGAWTGHDTEIAVWFDGWRFITPQKGFHLYDDDGGTFRVYDGTTWDTVTVT